MFLRHPSVAAHAYRTARREHEFRIVERIIGCLRQAGFDETSAARLYRVFADFVLGYSALDAGLASLNPPAPQPPAIQAARRAGNRVQSRAQLPESEA